MTALPQPYEPYPLEQQLSPSGPARHLHLVESPEAAARQVVAAREFVAELAMDGLRSVWQTEPVRNVADGQREPWILYAVRQYRYGRRLAAAETRRDRALGRLEHARLDLLDATASPDEYRPDSFLPEPTTRRAHNDWLRKDVAHHLKHGIKHLITT